MNVQEILQKTTQFFKQKGIASARLDSELVIARALGWRRLDLYLKSDYPVSEREMGIARELVRRRASGEPIAYIFGEKEFYGRDFQVNKNVLVPRPESEHVIDEALKFLKGLRGGAHIVDLGTGSGCLGLTLLCEQPEAELLAVDLSVEAIAVATANAQALGVSDRVQFCCLAAEKVDDALISERWSEPRVDLVVANPPYVAENDPIDPHVKKHEPALALFSKGGGLDHVRNWSARASAILKSQGLLLFEIGAEQGPAVSALCQGLKTLTDIQIIKDYSGHDRVLKATRL